MINGQRNRSLKSGSVDRRLLRVAVISMLIVLIGSGFALLSHSQQGPKAMHASPADMSVVGPPTLSASTIESIFANAGSPMAGTGQLIEQTSRATNIDDAFALGVFWAETNDGMAGVGLSNRNPGSVRGNTSYPTDGSGYTIYPSYSTAITDWFNLLRRSYVGQGLTTVDSISTSYVGTSGAPVWASKVISYAYKYRGEAPPPTVSTPTPPPTLVPTPKPVQKRVPPIVRHPQPIMDPGEKDRSGTAPISALRAANHQQPPDSSRLSPLTNALMVAAGLLVAFLMLLYGLRVERRKRAFLATHQESEALQPQAYDWQSDSQFSEIPVQDEKVTAPMTSLRGVDDPTSSENRLTSGGLLSRYRNEH